MTRWILTKRMTIMAQVPVIREWREAAPYLENQRRTIERDLRRLVGGEGAPFAICREVMSAIDHLGHLYTGSPQCGNRFRAFMEEVLGALDPNYRRRAGEVYQMYRCGAVHEFEPKTLRNRRGQTLLWLCYQGNRAGQQIEPPEIGRLTVTHLAPVEYAPGQSFALPVSTNCLLDDLAAAIERFRDLRPEDDRVRLWNQAAQDLTTPQPFEFTVP
jgi:hypothetical protein